MARQNSALAFDDDDDVVAASWTPEHVLVRLRDALSIIALLGDHGGPDGFTNNWPMIVREFSDYLGYDWKQYFQDRRADISEKGRRSFSSADLSMADEAMIWPMRYLADDPCACDAVLTWCFCRAVGLDLAKVLRARVLSADAMMRRRSQETPDVVRIYEDEAQGAAQKVATWANAALALAKDERMAGRIRAGARIRFAREIKAAGAVERIETVKRSDVMPGRCFTRQWVGIKRWEGAKQIAERLTADRVQVR